MTIRQAAEIVKALRAAGEREMAIELFDHFYDYFPFDVQDVLDFAAMCGYAVVESAKEEDALFA